MRNILFFAMAAAIAGGGFVASGTAAAQGSTRLNAGLSTVASTPDRGTFLTFASTAPVQRGASTWHAVHLSEAHALAAITKGGMVVAAPDGHPIQLRFVRSVSHADGNWTWIGRPAGAAKGVEAVLTFGKKAVFGTIPNGKALPLDLTTIGGRTYMVETDQSKLTAAQVAASGSDVIAAPTASGTSGVPFTAITAPRPTVTSSHNTRVDLIIGYTNGFATRLGGQSQAQTRLNFMVDLANQAYANSEVAGQLVLTRTIQVNYADNTLNRSTLYALSGVTCTATASTGQHYLPDMGVNCTTATVPAGLQPLIDARQHYGADLVALVRNYTQPENSTCGVAWLLGGAQHAIGAADANFGLSVVSDSSGSLYPTNGQTCRNETLAHEIGHNMGLAHDQAYAAGTDDSNNDGNLLDPEEYGRYADSFGYKTGAGAGNFYTIMAVPAPGQTAYRVFSNPRINTCGGFACGVVGQSDNAATLGLTMPVIAGFRAPPPSTLTPKQTP